MWFGVVLFERNKYLNNKIMGRMRPLTIEKTFTDRRIDRYISDIRKYKLVTVEEEILLAQKIRSGDESALKTLVEANLLFVISVAKKYQGLGIDLPDLINAGNLGLVKAASRFDETRGFKFISYAVWWIRQSILDSMFNESRIVRIPQNRLNLINKTIKAISELEQENEREPTDEEIAEVLDLEKEKVKGLLYDDVGRKHLSTDFPATIDGRETGTTFGDTIESTDPSHDPLYVVTDSEKKANVLKMLQDVCTEDEQMVVKLSFGIDTDDDQPLSCPEIAKRLGIKTSRARLLKELAFRKLRSPRKQRKWGRLVS